MTRIDRRLSWILIEPVPVFLLTYYLVNIHIWGFFVLFLLASAAYMCIYESGYIENDSITIMNEEYPVLRLPDDELAFVLKNINKIEFSRWSIAILVFVSIYFICVKYNISLNLVLFVCFIITVRVIYVTHNRFRNKSNIITLFLLSSFRYISIPCLFLELQTITRIVIILILIYPLPKTIEYASQKRYGISFLSSLTERNYPIFRLIYYLILFLTALFLLLIAGDRDIRMYYIAISMFGYFLAYRFFIFIFKLK